MDLQQKVKSHMGLELKELELEVKKVTWTKQKFTDNVGLKQKVKGHVPVGLELTLKKVTWA